MPAVEPIAWAADRATRRIVASWRRLTGDGPDATRPTLVACSGGADSSALALALSTTPAPISIGHVVHDLRPAERALADRDVAHDLAERLGVGFVEQRVEVAGDPGNDEGAARIARYDALAAMARDRGCRYVATAHHADDQLETLLMRLIRGSGLRGLSGVSPTRDLETGVTLVRPMLRVGRTDAERICRLARVSWAEDETNSDESRLRSAVRHGPAAGLRELEPAAAEHAGEACDMLRDAAGLIDDAAQNLLAEADETASELDWSRENLRGNRQVVVGAAIRAAAERLLEGRGMDRVSGRAVRDAVEAVGDSSTDPRLFVLHGVEVEVTAHRVCVRRKGDDG